MWLIPLTNTYILHFRVWYVDHRGNAKIFKLTNDVHDYQIDSILLAFNLKR